jgi:hypothetical protein
MRRRVAELVSSIETSPATPEVGDVSLSRANGDGATADVLGRGRDAAMAPSVDARLPYGR